MDDPNKIRMITTSAVEFASKGQFPEGAKFIIIGPFESHMAAGEVEPKLVAVLREQMTETVGSSLEEAPLSDRLAKYREWAHRGVFGDGIPVMEAIDLESTLSEAEERIRELEAKP